MKITTRGSKSQENKNAALILVLIMVTMFVIPIPLMFITILVLMLLISIMNNKAAVRDQSIYGLRQESIIYICLIAFFALMQAVILADSLRSAVHIYSRSFLTFFIPFIVYGLSKSFMDLKAYVKGISLFTILFSCYYIIRILVDGIPDGRNSALGFVSSNYIAAILLFTYPLLLYYLLKTREIKAQHRFLRLLCNISIVISLVVIITTGSRTAFFATGVVFVSLLFAVPRNTNSINKVIFLIVLAIITLFTLYYSFPVVESLIVRGIQGVQGAITGAEIDGDIRRIIWDQALLNFHESNLWIGSGSNIVYQFDQPVHNLPIEILLMSGYVGLAAFILIFLRYIYKVLKHGNYLKRFLIIQMIVVFCIVAYVQPFFTTAFTCTIIIWCSIFAMASDKTEAAKTEAED